MFTGIIESLGQITEASSKGSNRVFWISSTLSNELKIDESISHNGVCLTVEAVNGDNYQVSAVEETLKKTNAGSWKEGDFINLERSVRFNDRLNGHIVQGHVDGTAICTQKAEKAGSVEFSFRFDSNFAPLLIEKGSICVNGVSLTAFDVTRDTFAVAIIPYTFAHTNFHRMEPGDKVNLEFDVLGKYVARILAMNQKQ